jgi:hypothetical protein
MRCSRPRLDLSTKRREVGLVGEAQLEQRAVPHAAPERVRLRRLDRFVHREVEVLALAPLEVVGHGRHLSAGALD